MGVMAASSHHQLLQAIAQAGPISRADLAARIGLSRPAVTMLSRPLVETGLVLEHGRMAAPAIRAPGRPGVLLSLNASSLYFVGAYAAGDPLQIALTDLHGGIVAQLTRTLPRTPAALAGTLAEMLDPLCAMAGIQRQQLRGVGLALTGLIDHRRGVVLHSANLGWRDVALAGMIRQATGLPATLDNDARAAAVAERLSGAARQAEDFCVIVLGASVGCAQVLGGQLQRGQRGGAGELAHAMIVPDGLVCRCGRRGCLDTMVSRPMLTHAARQAGIDPQGGPVIACLEAHAGAGCTEARRILAEAGRALGLAIAHIVQINAPSLVVIAETDCAAGAAVGVFRAAIRDTMSAHVLPDLLAGLTLHFTAVGRGMWARGAASLAIQAFLDGSEAAA